MRKRQNMMETTTARALARMEARTKKRQQGRLERQDHLRKGRNGRLFAVDDGSSMILNRCAIVDNRIP